MSCKIEYKGKRLEKSEVISGLINNFQEFQELLTPETQRRLLNDASVPKKITGHHILDKVSKNIYKELPTSLKQALADEYKERVNTTRHKHLVFNQYLREVNAGVKNSYLVQSMESVLRKYLPTKVDESIDPFIVSLLKAITNTNVKTSSYPVVNKDTHKVVVNSNGKYEVVTNEEFKKLKIEDYPAIVHDIFKEYNSEGLNNVEERTHNVDRSKILSREEQSEVVTKMFGVLNKLGISVQSLENYRKNYQLKHGEDVTINAVADIANKVVAFNNDQDMEEHIAEETSHFIIEAYNDQNEILDALEHVESTETWKEYSQAYFDIYSQRGLEGDVLQEKVRREVLGKILADRIVAEESEAKNRVQDILDSFINRVKAFFKPNMKNDMDVLLDKIMDSINNQKKLDNIISRESLDKSSFDVFFSAARSVETNYLQKALDSATKQQAINKNNSVGRTTKSKLNTLKGLVEQTTPITYLDKAYSTSLYLDIVDEVSKNLMLKLNIYDSMIASSLNTGVLFTNSEVSSLKLLISEMKPVMSRLQSNLMEEDLSKDATALRDRDRLMNKINQLQSDIDVTLGRASNINDLTSHKVVQKMLYDLRISEENQAQIMNSIASEQKDISNFARHIGSMVDSHIYPIKLLGQLVSDMYAKVRNKDKVVLSALYEKLKEYGFEKSTNKLIKMVGGKNSGYLQNIINWSDFNKAKDTELLRLYNQALDAHQVGVAPKDILPHITKLKQIGTKDSLYPKVLDMSEDIQDKWEEDWEKWRDENEEHMYVGKSFRLERLQMYKDIKANVSDKYKIKTFDSSGNITEIAYKGSITKEVKDLLKGWSTRTSEIKSKYVVNKGVDYNAMTAAERLELEAIKKEKKTATSLFNSDMTKKSGRELKNAEALLAISAYYRENAKLGGTRSLSNDYLNNIRSGTAGLTTTADIHAKNAKQFEEFMNSVGFGFTSEFWDKSGARKDLKVMVDAFIKASSLPAGHSSLTELELNTDDLISKLNERSALLKQYSNSKNPSEIDVSFMSNSTKVQFRELENDIIRLTKAVNDTLGPSARTVVTETESTTNKSYSEDFKSQKEAKLFVNELDFARANMSARNLIASENFESNLRKAMQGDTSALKTMKKQLIGMLNLVPTTTIPELVAALGATTLEDLTLVHAKSKVAGYYKRYAPKGFDELLTILKSGNLDGDMKFIEFVESINNSTSTSPASIILKNTLGKDNDTAKFLQFNADFDMFEDPSPRTENENFVKTNALSTFYGGFVQPKLSKYRDSDFINTHNIDETAYKLTGVLRTKDAKHPMANKVNAIQLLVQNKYDAATRQKVGQSSNSYMIPQISANTNENYTKVKGISTTVREAFKTIKDKKEFGQTLSGLFEGGSVDTTLSNLAIPVLGINEFEDQSQVSTDLLYSAAKLTHNSHMYEERENHMGQAYSLMDLLERQKIKGKEVKNSRAFAAFEDYMKIYMYGVQELKDVTMDLGENTYSLTKAIRTTSGTLSTVNVGMNPVVSMTAFGSSTVFSLIEGIVGDYVAPKSYKDGALLATTLAADFISQTGSVNNSSKLKVFGEHFGIFNIMDRFIGSDSNKLLRMGLNDGVTGLSHMMTRICSHPFAPMAMASVMVDFRYVEVEDSSTPSGKSFKLMDKNNFNSLAEFKTLSKKEINRLWDSYRNNALDKLLDTKGTEVDFSRLEEFLLKSVKMEPTDLAKELFFIQQSVSRKTEVLIAIIEAKMPETDKSIASRNVLTSMLLTHRQWLWINYAKRFKPRSYNPATGKNEEGSFKTLFEVVKGGIKSIVGRDADEFRNIYKNLDSTQKKNINRVMIDLAFSVGVLSLTGLLLMGIDDDDEKGKEVAYLRRLAAYIVVRTASEQASVGLFGIPQAADVVDKPIVLWNSVKQLFVRKNYSSSEVRSGAYKGHSKLFQSVMKQTWARHYFDMTPEGLKKKMDFFRVLNDWTLYGTEKDTKEERKEKRKQYIESGGDVHAPVYIQNIDDSED